MDPRARPPVDARTARGTGLDQAPDLRQAYTLAREAATQAPSGFRGHRLIWVRGVALGASVLYAHPDAFLVVGRHSQCGLVLREDPSLALRHILVRSIPLASGSSALRVLDLHTGRGFVLSDGSRQTSIFAEGPVALAIGHHALVAFPAGAREGGLPRALPAQELETAARDQLAAMQQAMSPYRANARLDRSTRITLMPRLLMIGEIVPPGERRGGTWSITLERSGRTATLPVGEEELTGGIVIGRSEKCHAEALRRVTDSGTSRVHVLVVREGGRVFAYDLASTHGTFHDGAPVRRVMLSDEGTVLTMGRGDGAVRMYWQRSKG